MIIDSSHQYIIRPEDFGGMIYDLDARKLHRLDEEEYKKLHDAKLSNIEVRGEENVSVNVGLRAPIKLYIDITTHCNLKCKHCLSSSGTNLASLTFEEVCGIIEDIKKMGVFRVKIGGGEPILHPDFWKIVDAFNEARITVSTSTNGVLISLDPSLATKFFEKRVKVSVSIDGDKDMHNYIRGQENSYDMAVKAIEILTKAGVKTVIGSTMFPINLKTVPKVIELAERFNVAVKFKRAKPAGRAINNELVITKPTEEYWEVARMINKCELARVEGIMDLGTNKKKKVLDQDYYNCGAGTATCHIDSWANISPCIFMGPEFTSGNVRKEKFSEVWVNGNGFKQMRSVAKKGNPKCAQCSHRTVCCGECRAFALYVNHDIGSVDPCCPSGHLLG